MRPESVKKLARKQLDTLKDAKLSRFSDIYHKLIIILFSLGLALLLTSLIDAQLPIQLIKLFFPDEPGEVAGLLKISPQILLILYSVLITGVAGLMYLLEDYLSLDSHPMEIWDSPPTSRIITTISFIATFIAVRAIVAISGVVGPGTTGKAGGLPVIQIALPGFRVHHYVFGVLIFIGLLYHMLFHEDYSEKLIATLYGVGLGLFIDEIGLILSQGDYFTLSTYIFVTVFAAFFLTGLYLDIDSRRNQ